MTARSEEGAGAGGGGGGAGAGAGAGGGGGGGGLNAEEISEAKKKVLYQSFKANKEKSQAESKKPDTLHLDTEDANEKARQKEEARRESVHERQLSHRRIEGFAELMAAKERFEFERRLVQRAEVRRFMCQVFLDMTALEDERKIDKGFFASVTDYVTCNLGPYSTEPPVRASRTTRTSRTSRSSHIAVGTNGKKKHSDAVTNGDKHVLNQEIIEADVIQTSATQGDVAAQDTACVVS